MYGADDENQALIPRRGEGNSDTKRHGIGILVNRIVILVLLVVLVGASVYYQSQMTILKNEIKGEEKTIQDLVSAVARFNSSVTNSDVVKRLASLEDALDSTTHDLKKEMKDLETKVNDQLQSTLTELGDTVKDAKDEISKEVDKVKKDVDQYVITTQDQFSMENSFMVYQLAGTLTLLSCLISMWHMTAHLRKMYEPFVQRKILAILWMSPIYAVTSWFSLVFHQAEGYLAIIKDGYEAYIIYQFLSFCIAVIGKGDRHKVVDLLSKRADHLTPPFRLCWCCDRGDPYHGDPHALADAILLQCQIFGLQFVFLRPLTTIAMVVLEKLEYYGAGDGPEDYRSPQFYIVIIQNVSIFTAFCGLLKFYHACEKELEWCRPFAKFLCIKGVVFMTFWQGLAIKILSETTDVGGDQADEWAKSAQNFLICLEMLLFSIAHFYCFPTEEWKPGYRAKASRGITESLALGDFVQDIKLILKSSKRKKKSKKPSEPTVPEGDEETDVDDDDETAISSVASSSADAGLAAVLDSIANEDDDDDDDGENEAVGGTGVVEDTEMGEDPEVSAARARLELLEALSFGLPSPTSRANSIVSRGEGTVNEATEEGGNTETTREYTIAAETTSLLDGKHESSSDDEEEVLPRTKNEEILQPSVFTSFGKNS